jgi:GNAT superfamily N-acetyltransferase
MHNATAVVVRPARPADVPLVARLIRDLAEYEKMSDACFAEDDTLREHLFGERPYAEVLIGCLDGAPVGFALFFHNYSTFLTKPGIYLEDLFVRPEFRDFGVGKALLAELAQVAVSRGCGRLEWSVLKWNAPAIGFYLKLGAEAMEEWQVYRLAGEPLAELARASAASCREIGQG